MPADARPPHIRILLVAFAFHCFCRLPRSAQAALLMEEPYGFFGTVNPNRTYRHLFRAYLRGDPDQASALRAGGDGGGYFPLQQCKRL